MLLLLGLLQQLVQEEVQVPLLSLRVVEKKNWLNRNSSLEMTFSFLEELVQVQVVVMELVPEREAS